MFRASIAKVAIGDVARISPPGASIPAPAQLASPPIAPLSKTVTGKRRCPRRQAILSPTMPPPATATFTPIPELDPYPRHRAALRREMLWRHDSRPAEPGKPGGSFAPYSALSREFPAANPL